MTQRYHSILPDLVHRSHRQGGNAQYILEQLDGQFNNLASATTNNPVALDQLAAATTEQYAEIKAALDNLTVAVPSNPTPRSTPRKTNPLSLTEKRVMEKRVLILQSAVKNK